MTTDELVAYYTNLIIAQYNTLPNASATVELFIRVALQDQIVNKIIGGFDLETAIGSQLDVLRKYTNAPRLVAGLTIARNYFAYPEYSDVSAGFYVGFPSYSDISDPVGLFRFYIDDSSNAYRLTDDELRRLIQFNIAVNTMNISVSNIDELLSSVFGTDCTLTDGLDMTLTYEFTPGLTDTLPKIVAYTNSLPAPAGVLITTTGV